MRSEREKLRKLSERKKYEKARKKMIDWNFVKKIGMNAKKERKKERKKTE